MIARHHDTKDMDNKEHTYLAVFGRKGKTLFSMEDIRHVIDQEHIYTLMHNEFQFKEETIKNNLTINITLYKRGNTSISSQKIKTIITNMTKHLEKISGKKISLSISIKNENDRIGYKSGKLRYLLNQ